MPNEPQEWSFDWVYDPADDADALLPSFPPVKVLTIEGQYLDTMAKIEQYIYTAFGLTPEQLRDNGSNGSSRQAKEVQRIFAEHMARRTGVCP